MSSGGQSRVAFNTAAGAGAQFVVLFINLFITPVILSSLGKTDFGAYAVIGSFVTYFGVLDLGIGGSLTRFMVFYNQRGDSRRVGAFATFGVMFYIAMAAVLLPALVVAAPTIGRLLALPIGIEADFPFLIATVGILFIGWALTGIVSARLAASHRLDLTALATVCGSIGMAALVCITVPRYPAIETVFACMLGQLMIVWLILFVVNRRLHGALLVSPRRMRWNEIRELFSFGLWSQLSNVTAVVNLEADKVIISRGIGIANVTPYQVANRLALLSRALPLQLLVSLLPSITARVSAGATGDELARLYKDTSRTLMLPTLLIAGFVVAAADPLLRLWLGVRLPGAAALCMALVLSYAANNATGAGTTILKAVGQPNLEAAYGVLSAVMNIVLTIMLIRPLGLTGVVMGTIGGNVVGSVIFLVIFHRRQGFPWWETMGSWLSSLCFLTASSGLVAWSLLFLLVGPTMDRLFLLGGITVVGLAYCAVFILFGWMIGFWTNEDHAAIARLLAALRRQRARPS